LPGVGLFGPVDILKKNISLFFGQSISAIRFYYVTVTKLLFFSVKAGIKHLSDHIFKSLMNG
jgi:hypothetical protein